MTASSSASLVRAADGEQVGTVTDVLHLPLQDTLEVATDRGVTLIPFVTAVVPRVDLGAGELHLADVPGLLVDEDDEDDEVDEDDEDQADGPADPRRSGPA